MVWPDMCSWASCLGKRKEDLEDTIAPRPVSKPTYDIDHQEVSEKKLAKSLHPPAPPPSVASELPQRRRRERNLPPVPAMPVSSVYEIGVSSPRTSVCRSNSKSSIRTTTSSKNGKNETQYPEKQKSPSVGLRRPSHAKGGMLVSEKQAVERSNSGSPHKSHSHKRSVSSANPRDGKTPPFPISTRSSSRKVKRDDELPIACDDEEEDESSQRELRRRSDSAPIPLKKGHLVSTLKHTHTIRRKPVTPKPSTSFAEPSTEENAPTDTFVEQLDVSKDAVEMDVPAFELSADPQSRAQSYYADVGIFLLTETLDKPPPMPSQPALALNTSVNQQYPIPNAATSKRFTFSPMTTVSSPVEDPHVSPITPWERRSRNKMSLAKRSKSVGSASLPRLQGNVKRRSLDDDDEKSPRPTLPTSRYSPTTSLPLSHTNSLLKAEFSEDSSHRASDTSDKSESSSRSSIPSRGPSPSYMEKVKIIKRRRRPEQDSETLKPIAFQRRSTNAPIPILSADDMPSVPRLPPQAYHFATAKPETPKSEGGLVRSLSTKNLRTQEAAQNLPKFGRSKSIYYQVTAWNDSNTPQPSRLNEALPALPLHPASIPLPESDTDSNVDSEYDSEFESEYGSAQSGVVAAELDSHDQEQYLVETGPRSVLTTPIEREDPMKGTWGKGLGAEWGVAY